MTQVFYGQRELKTGFWFGPLPQWTDLPLNCLCVSLLTFGILGWCLGNPNIVSTDPECMLTSVSRHFVWKITSMMDIEAVPPIQETYEYLPWYAQHFTCGGYNGPVYFKAVMPVDPP